MKDESFLDEIGLGTNNRHSTSYGFFDVFALCASYVFSYEQYLHDKKRSRPDQPLTEVHKTTLHETTHLYQMLATPYGLYYSTLRLLQTDLIRHLIHILPQKYRVQFKPPLITFCRKLKSACDIQIRHLLHGWAMAELMILYLEGNFENYSYLLNNSLLGANTMSEYFERLEFFVTIFLNDNGKPCPIFDSSGLEPSKTSLISELLYLGLKTVNFPDTRGVMESWAKVAEYWGDQQLPLADCPQLFPPVIEAQMADYYLLLHWARDAIKATTVGEFILSYMALCEIALSPPLLPYYRLRRSKNMTLQEVNPIQRMMDLFTVVKGVDPIRNLENDYMRFTQEICSRLKWPMPIEIALDTLNSLRCPRGDKLFEFSMKAQFFRSRIPYIFLDLGVWFLPERPYSRDFYYYFSHPVIEFTDRVGYHPDQSVVVFFTEQALINTYIRKLLLASDQSVTFPYKASPAELNYFTHLLTSDLETLLRVKPIKVTLVNPD